MRAPGNEPLSELSGLSPDNLLKKRLSALLAALGELPIDPASLPAGAGHGLSRLLDEICPVGTLIVHRKWLSGDLDLPHLVVAPRGLVVVAPEWAPARLGTPRRGALAALPDPRGRRSSIVRTTLRRAHGLHLWLGGTPWAATPVLAAACSAPSIGAPPPSAVIIEHLWLGPVERLGLWLGAGGRLSPAEQASLAHFLSEELPSAP